MNSKFATGKSSNRELNPPCKLHPNIILVPERPNFPKEEEKVLKFWTEIKAFE
jgi:hypothetical protein